MTTEWPAYRICGVASLLLTVVGFVSSWLTMRVREYQGLSEREFLDSAVGSTAVWLSAGCFMVGLLILCPLALYLQRRAKVPRPGLRLPAWLAWPVKVLFSLVIGFMLVLWSLAAFQWFAY